MVEQMCGYDQLRYSCTAWSIESDAKGKCDNGDDYYDFVVVDDNDCMMMMTLMMMIMLLMIMIMVMIIIIMIIVDMR